MKSYKQITKASLPDLWSSSSTKKRKLQASPLDLDVPQYITKSSNTEAKVKMAFAIKHVTKQRPVWNPAGRTLQSKSPKTIHTEKIAVLVLDRLVAFLVDLQKHSVSDGVLKQGAFRLRGKASIILGQSWQLRWSRGGCWFPAVAL